MSTQSWQVPCPRCGWANSGALTKCAKCGQLLGARPGMLVAGQSLSARPEQPRSSKVAKPGGFLPRLIALIVDLMILGAILLPINALWVAQLAPLEIKPDTNVAFETLQRRASLYLALVVIQLFYFAGSWTMLGATPGQLLMSLRVTDARAGGIGFFRAAFRWFLFTIFGGGLVGVITMIVGKNKRALHDILAGTYVIQVVDASDVEGDSGLPVSFGGKPGHAEAAPAPAPAPAPDPCTRACARRGGHGCSPGCHRRGLRLRPAGQARFQHGLCSRPPASTSRRPRWRHSENRLRCTSPRRCRVLRPPAPAARPQTTTGCTRRRR